MPQLGRGERVHRYAVDQHGALVGVAQPPGQRGQQGLAGAGAPHQRDRTAAGDGQVERAEQYPVVVAHHHAAQHHLPTAARREGGRTGFGGPERQQFVGPALPGPRVRHPDQRLDLLEQSRAERRPAGPPRRAPWGQGAAREERLAVASTVTSTTAISRVACQAVRRCAAQSACPAADSSGSGASTRAASRCSAPAAWMLRSPVRAPLSRAARSAWTAW